VIIEDKIRDRQAGRKFSLRLCPAPNGLAQFPTCLSPVVPPLVGISNRELTVQRASASRLPRAHFAKGASEQDSKLVPQLSSMNRANQSLSPYEIRRRQRAISKIKSPNSVSRMCSNSLKTKGRDILKSPKNQEMDSRFFARFSPPATDVTLFVACASHLLALFTLTKEGTQEEPLTTSHSTVLSGSAPHSRTAVTYRKQTAAHFLTGSRIAQSESRARAKMNAETSRIR
jgi:hypothetical protein